jgi:tetratricopeptide (TPR) repeat protein
MNGNLSRVSDPWFQEGFAEYFSSTEVDGKQARVGKIPDQTYEILRQNGMMKVTDLLRVQQNSSTYNESGDHRTVFYAQSAMLVHYFYDNALFPKLGAYFDLRVQKGLTVEDALQQAFGMSATQFDKMLREYVAGGHYKYYALPTPPDIVQKGYTLKALTALDASTVIADIHMHSMDYREKAVGEFEEILKTDPNNAAASRGLGYASLQKGDFKRAGEYFKRAAAADSKDPRVHYYFALLMNREGSFSSNNEDLSEMTREIETAISLDPNFADAYTLLAFAMAQAGQPEKALAGMQKAVSLSPGNVNYQFELAQMYMSNRKVDDAISIFKVLSKNPDADVAQRGASALESAQEYKASLERPRELIVRTPAADAALTSSSGSVTMPNSSPVKFVKGTLVGVDCSAAPSAILTVISGPSTWRMRVADTKHVLVLGADAFSCDWKKQKVALNYRATGEGSGSVVSIEVQ